MHATKFAEIPGGYPSDIVWIPSPNVVDEISWDNFVCCLPRNKKGVPRYLIKVICSGIYIYNFGIKLFKFRFITFHIRIYADWCLFSFHQILESFYLYVMAAFIVVKYFSQKTVCQGMKLIAWGKSNRPRVPRPVEMINFTKIYSEKESETNG